MTEDNVTDTGAPGDSAELVVGSRPRFAAAALADMHAAAFADPRSGAAPWSAASMAQMIDGDGMLWVDLRDPAHPDRPAGFALFRKAGPEAELLTIARAPERKAVGDGARLLAAGIEALKATTVEILFLEVAEGNKPARRLYEAQGFRRVGRRPRYYHRNDGVCDDALILAINL